MQALRLTAVVVLPTPPFWLAMATISAMAIPPCTVHTPHYRGVADVCQCPGGNLGGGRPRAAGQGGAGRMFHVKQGARRANQAAAVQGMFHVKHTRMVMQGKGGLRR